MNYFAQKIKIDSTFKTQHRFDLIKQYVENKKVLHVGCVDYPITDINNNLHIKLKPLCKRLDGVDTNFNDETRRILGAENGKLFDSLSEIDTDYDVVLVPEVIEHVGDVETFLGSLDKIDCKIMIITAPDIFAFKKDQLKAVENDMWVEIVHPDHNCWYSPYTLKNVLSKYLKSFKVMSLHWTSGSIGAICEKQK